MSNAERLPASTSSRRSWPLWLPLAVTALLLAFDQWTKWLAVTNLQHLESSGRIEPVIPGLLGLTLTYNTGAAWSLLEGAAFPLAILRFVVGIGLLVYVLGRRTDRFSTIVFSMISAGAIGNAIDGFRQGKVTDMLSSPLLDAVTRALNGQPFPIFNLADSYVVIGVTLLLIGSFFRRA